MKLIKEILQLKTNFVPRTIKGKPLSDYSVVLGVYGGVYTIYAQQRVVGKNEKLTKHEVATFDNSEDADDYLKKLIANGAKPSRTDWRA